MTTECSPCGLRQKIPLRGIQFALLLGIVFLFFMSSAYADDQNTANFRIPFDVNNAGGADVSKSNMYLLSDSLGEPIVGFGSTNNYILNSGYRQPSASEFLSLSCSAMVEIGSVVGTGQKTGSGTCIVSTDAYSGYSLGWAVLSGSGGTNTGHLINQYNDTIAPFTPSVLNVPETWSVASTDAEWGARLRSSSTDSGSEWGTDAASEKWLNIATSNRTIVTRTSSTLYEGSTQIIQFRSDIGAAKLQPTGTYLATVTLTAVGY